MQYQVSQDPSALKITKHLKAQVSKWIKALRSGKFHQTQETLEDSIGHCCLGVACKIFIPAPKLTMSGNFLKGGNASDQKSSPEWLIQINSDFRRRMGKGLVDLNDEGIVLDESEPSALTFDEIADMLQLVYIQEVDTRERV